MLMPEENQPNAEAELDKLTTSEEVRRAEAQGEDTITLTYRGRSYTVPRDYSKWPAKAGLALAKRQDDLIVLEALLAPEDFEDFLAQRPTNADASTMVVEFIKGLGFKDPGESEASSA